MKLSIQEQQYFYTHQLREVEREHFEYINNTIETNLKNGSLFLGKIVGIDDKRGNLLVNFQGKHIPRLEMLYHGYIFKNPPKDRLIQSWSIRFFDFIQKHRVFDTELTPIFYKHSKSCEGITLGFKNISAEFIQFIQPYIDKKKEISLLVGQAMPIIELLVILSKYIERFQHAPLLNENLDNELSNWSPVVLKGENKTAAILANLIDSNRLIIQGPPGTGKSYLISQLVHHFSQQGLRVCITALANKTLVELCSKQEMNMLVEKGKVYKTSLKMSEMNEFPKLKEGKGVYLAAGEVSLTTFYSMKDHIKNLLDSTNTLFDVLIVEEASQAFLTLISAFYQLSKKTLLVGDPMQLSPVVIDYRNLYEMNYRYKPYAEGLATVAVNTNTPSFILTESFRLNVSACEQSNVFYQGRLSSVQQQVYIPLPCTKVFEKYITHNGGAVVTTHFDLTDYQQLMNAMHDCLDFVESLVSINKKAKIAVLSPYIKNISKLLELKLARKNIKGNILIETIDRVQGITVDFTVLFFPVTNPLFEFDPTRFNVATSRATHGNLIYISKRYEQLSINEKVKLFLNSSVRV